MTTQGKQEIVIDLNDATYVSSNHPRDDLHPMTARSRRLDNTADQYFHLLGTFDRVIDLYRPILE